MNKIVFFTFRNENCYIRWLNFSIFLSDINKYSILFANQIKEELIIYNKEREQGIQEIVKERTNEIQKLNTFLLCAPNYDTKSLILLRKTIII